MRWLNLLFVLAINAVPFYGAMSLGWSVSTILVLFWVENVLIIIATSVRIVLHRIWTRKRGHWEIAPDANAVAAPGPVNGNAFLIAYLGVTGIFTLAHGVFVVGLAVGMSQHHPDQSMWLFSFAQLRQGAATLSIMLAINLLADLPSLRQRSFASLKAYADSRMARVIILHLGIIFGMLAIMMTDSPLGLLGVLIGLKTLVELSATWYGDAAQIDAQGAEPPAWAVEASRSVAGSERRKADAFLAKWRDAHAQQQRDQKMEEVMPAS
jgi:Family of unknown function (DUF6498)